MVGLPSGACGGDLSSRVTELSNLYHLPFSMFRALISSLILHCLGKAAQIAEAQCLLEGGHARPLIIAMTVEELAQLDVELTASHLRRWTLASSLMKGRLLCASSIVFLNVPM